LRHYAYGSVRNLPKNVTNRFNDPLWHCMSNVEKSILPSKASVEFCSSRHRSDWGSCCNEELKRFEPSSSEDGTVCESKDILKSNKMQIQQKNSNHFVLSTNFTFFNTNNNDENVYLNLNCFFFSLMLCRHKMLKLEMQNFCSNWSSFSPLFSQREKT